MEQDIYRFGDYEFAADGELRRHGMPVKLQQQPLHILLLLLERADEVVTRDELRAMLWPANTYVEFDAGLNAALRRLRQSLRDSADKPVYIETVPRQGYRFIAPVSVMCAKPEAALAIAPPAIAKEDKASAISPSTALHGPHFRRKWVIGAAVGLGTLFSLWSNRPLAPLPQVVRIVPLSDSGTIPPNQTLVTDGPRLFFHEQVDGERVLSFVRTDEAGERTSLGPFKAMDVESISPDGADLLVHDIGKDGEVAPEEGQAWIYPLLKGTPRPLRQKTHDGT